MSIFAKLPPRVGEICETLHHQNGVEITHIVSSARLPDKIYDQDTDEWVIVLAGDAVLEVDGAEKHLGAGDFIFLPAHTPHQVLRCREGTQWLAAHFAHS